jgi:hypothetical protein
MDIGVADAAELDIDMDIVIVEFATGELERC